MKIFTCSQCQQLLFFENSSCTHCGSLLAYLPDVGVVSVLEQATSPGTTESDARQEPLYTARSPAAGGARYRLCGNYAEHAACNWAVAEHDDYELCRACRLNRMIPNLADPVAKNAWVKLERAKRRLVYTLLALHVPLDTKREDPERGLAFVFKQDDGAQKVVTGHGHGVVTINIAEADDVFREKMRVQLREPYRTLLGHFRHEIGHYYWERLVPRNPARLSEFRATFGDERADYAQSMRTHYARGPVRDWSVRFVSAYASMHPWEDWAETFAHYLHMVDTLEMAQSYGLVLRPKPEDGTRETTMRATQLDAYDFDNLIRSWFPLTVALNSFNRGMGLPDLYPFVLTDRTIDKLRMVHAVIAHTPIA